MTYIAISLIREPISDPAVSIAGKGPTRDPAYITAILLPYKMAVSMQKIIYFQVEYMDDAYICRHTIYNKGIIHVQKFCTFDCYDILPALKQEVRFAAHEFHVALVDEQG